MSLRYRILGPLDVRRDGAPVPLGRSQQRAVLALLLIRPNQFVSSERIIDQLWPDAPPPTALNAVQGHVSRLRKELGRDAIRTQGTGYVLDTAADAIDAARFEALAERGRAALAAGRAEAALVPLTEGLGLWRGEALAEFALEPWAEAEAARLEARRLAAIGDRIEVELALGRHGSLVGELDVLVAGHPFDERFSRQLMLALYRAGRQADALGAYTRLRVRLGEELGLVPGPEAQQLESAILRQDDGLAWARPGAGDQPAVRTTGTRPMPPGLARTGTGAFVGRAEVLDRLDLAWKGAASGDSRALMLSGEPGIGRTRITAELATRVVHEATEVLFGRCDEGLGVPYQPFVEALRGFVHGRSAAELEATLGRYPEELARLVPDIAELVDLRSPLRSDGPTERYRLFAAVEDWLAAASRFEPVLLVLDDLQWATRPTLLLLRHLVRFSQPARVLLLGTYRDTEVGRHGALADVLADLWREPTVERVPIAGLDRTEIAELVDATAGDHLGLAGHGDRDELAAAVHAETSGNPFFAVQVIRSLLESDADADAATHELPQNVREVVGRRLSQLAPATNEALMWAAVIGTDFASHLLTAVVPLDAGTLAAAIDEALASKLVEVVPGRPLGYRFAHALVRDTLYQELRTPKRMRLHRVVGEAIEALAADRVDDVLPELARHFGESVGTVDVSKAVQFMRRASERSLAQLAPDEAAAYLTRAIELLDLAAAPDHDPQRLDLLVRLGDAERRAGLAGHRETLLRAADLAHAVGDHELLVRAALANSRGLWSASGEVDRQRRTALERAIAVTPATDAAVRARLDAALAAELVFDPDDHDRRFTLSQRAVAGARTAGDPHLLADVLTMHATTVWAPGWLDERVAAGEEALAIAADIGDPELTARIWVWAQAVPAFESMDIGRLDRALEEATRLGEDLRHPTVRWAAAVFRSSRELLAGRIDEAEALALSGLALGEDAGQPDAFVIFAGQLWFLRYEQGRTEEIFDTVRSVIEEVPGLPAWTAMLGVSCCETGRDDEAAAILDGIARRGFEHLPQDATGLLSLAACSVICAHVGDGDRARLLLPLVTPLAGRMLTVGTGNLGAASHFLGLLHRTAGHGDEADDWFRRAALEHARIRARGFQARTALEHARLLLALDRPDDHVRATELLTEARGLAERIGQRSVVGPAAQLLAEL